jgi:two-component system OmpR family response regulator
MTDRKIIIADTDEQVLQELKEGLEKDGFIVSTTTDAHGLVSSTTAQPSILVVNPDMKGFNAYDICKKVKREGNIPVVLLMDTNSTTRAQIDECIPDDVVTKPVKIDNLANLLRKHYTVTSNTK